MTSTPATTPRAPGALIAGATALVSGVSVLVNSYAVHDFSDATAYTTAKNLVAALVLGLVAALVGRRGAAVAAAPVGGRRSRLGRLFGLAYVGVVGGGIAFALFFEGLARTSAVPAAFLKDTLVVFVAVLAPVLLRERVSPANIAAIAALAAGSVAISGGVGGLSPSRGNLLVLAATVLWAGEVVVAKRLLAAVRPERLALLRMGVGAATLLAYLGVRGGLGTLGSLDSHQIGWILVTGALLAAYVGTWFAALGRARAIDVTSVLVCSAALTAVLQAALGRAGLGVGAGIGIALVVVGTALVYRRWPRRALA